MGESNGTESVESGKKIRKYFTQNSVELNHKILSVSLMFEDSSVYLYYVTHFNAGNVATEFHLLAKLNRINDSHKCAGETFPLKKVLKLRHKQSK